MKKAYPRHMRTPITDANDIFKIIEGYINQGLYLESNLSLALADILDRIKHKKSIDCSVLDSLIAQYGDIEKGYKPSEKGVFALPIFYAAQAYKSYMVKSQDSINLAWSFIADAKYWLGFSTQAILSKKILNESAERLTKGANELLAELDTALAERDKALVERDESLADFSKYTKQMFEDGIETKLKYDSYFDEAKRVGIDREIEINKFLDEIMDYQVIALEKNLEIDNGLTELINKAKAIREKSAFNRHGVADGAWKLKRDAIEFFEANKNKYQSTPEAVKAIAEKQVLLKERTVYNHLLEHIEKKIAEYYEKNVDEFKNENDEKIASAIFDSKIAHPFRLTDIAKHIKKHREQKHTLS
jgi:hypothetical protein